MIHANLKGRLMNFNEAQDENNINPVVIIASYIHQREQMNKALLALGTKYGYFLLLF